MKNLILTFMVIAICVVAVNGQAPKSIKYQTIIRDASGEIIENQQVNIVLKIFQGSATGNEVCSETFNPTTNEFGLVNLEIGSVEPVAFSAIDWANGPYFLQVELNGNIMGTSELLSVPYALYSERSNNSYWDKIGTSIFYNEGNVGIGTSQPKTSLHIVSDDPDISLDIPSASEANLAQIKFRRNDTLKASISWNKNDERFYISNQGYPSLQIHKGRLGIGTYPTKQLNILGDVVIDGGSHALALKPGTNNHTYIDFYADSDNPDTRSAYFGYGWANTETITLKNEMEDGDILLITNNGNVGIGTYDPTSKLDVKGNVTIRDESTGNIAVELGTGLDYAEGFNVDNVSGIVPGTVLCIDPANYGKLKISDLPYDRKVAGIVAGANQLGSGISLGADTHDFNVALAGRVYCFVDATDEAIEAGDLLTTSLIPGYAMKVTNYLEAQGAVIGKAMESLEKGKKGKILVLVTLQ